MAFAGAWELVALLFPPFRFDMPGRPHENAGYSFLLDPPSVDINVAFQTVTVYASVHVAMLLAEVVIIAVVVGAFYLSLGQYSRPSSQ